MEPAMQTMMRTTLFVLALVPWGSESALAQAYPSPASGPPSASSPPLASNPPSQSGQSVEPIPPVDLSPSTRRDSNRAHPSALLLGAVGDRPTAGRRPYGYGDVP